MEEIEEAEDHDQESLQNIERTLLELNSIFQRMSTIVEEHQTLIERIDINTEAALDYAEKGKKELSEAYKTLADCRKLMLKVSGWWRVDILHFVCVFDPLYSVPCVIDSI